jgi:hypothetical protein
VTTRAHDHAPVELRTRAQLALVSILALAACSKGTTPEQLTSRRLDLLHELALVLVEVTDKDSAVAREKTVARIVDDMNTVRRHFTWLTDGEKQTLQKVAAGCAPQNQAAVDRLRHELTRIRASTDIQPVLGPVLDKL